MLDRTLAAMARGGIFDQLGGGFARYSVDAGWVVPHFEKMLYDNAQLLGLYARWGTPIGDRVARLTGDFLLRELTTSEGGLASALDADSEGEEGRFYVWTPDQLTEVLGPDDGAWAAEVLEVTGTFEHGTSTLQLLRDPDDPSRFDEVRRRLLAARETRVRPARDDKVVAAWNGLAISSLCDAGRLLGEERYVDAALLAGALLADVHLVDGRLRRVSRDGRVGAPLGVLEDHGAVAAGFLALCGVTADESWLARATELLDTALRLFRADDGGFHDTPSDGERLVARPRDPSDNASPSGTSAMIHALLAAHALTGDGRWSDAAEEALAGVADLARRAPRFAGWSLAAAQAVLVGAPEIAVVGPQGADRDHLERRARAWPGATVVVADGGGRGHPAARGARPGRRSPGGVRVPLDGLCRPGDEPRRFVSGGCSVPLVLPRPRPGGAAKQNEVRMGDPTEGETSTPLVDDLTRIAESVREHRRRRQRPGQPASSTTSGSRSSRSPARSPQPTPTSCPVCAGAGTTSPAAWSTPSSWDACTSPVAARCPTSPFRATTRPAPPARPGPTTCCSHPCAHRPVSCSGC